MSFCSATVSWGEPLITFTSWRLLNEQEQQRRVGEGSQKQTPYIHRERGSEREIERETQAFQQPTDKCNNFVTLLISAPWPPNSTRYKPPATVPPRTAGIPRRFLNRFITQAAKRWVYFHRVPQFPISKRRTERRDKSDRYFTGGDPPAASVRIGQLERHQFLPAVSWLGRAGLYQQQRGQSALLSVAVSHVCAELRLHSRACTAPRLFTAQTASEMFCYMWHTYSISPFSFTLRLLVLQLAFLHE